MVFSKMKEMHSAMMPHSEEDSDNITMFEGVRNPTDYENCMRKTDRK